MAGVYANFANVSHSDYEFTITFARVDHEVEDDEIPGVVVSRVNLSPRFMRELIDAMEDNYSKWQTREGIKNLPEFGGPDEPRRVGSRGYAAARANAASRSSRTSTRNRHAFEAVLDAVAASRRRGAVVPRRPRRLRRRARRLRRAGAPARGRLPRRQPRPRGDAASCRSSEFSRGAELAARWTQEVIAPQSLAFLAGARAAEARRGRRALPRQPARPGVGVRALAAAGRAVPRRAQAPDRVHRPLPHGALVRARRRRARHRRHRAVPAPSSTSAAARGC